MSKTNRREVAKRLTQEIAVTTDPKTLIRLTTALAKVLPKPKQTKRRKPVEVRLVTQPGRLSKRRVTGSMVDQLSDAEWLLHDLVEQVENKCKGRGGWNSLTRAEKDALLAEATATLSAEERAALEALNMEKVA